MAHENPSWPCEHATRRLLPWFATGRLAADEAAAVEAHLRTCAACRNEYAWDRELAATLAHGERVELAPHAGLQQFMARLDGEADRQSARRTTHRFKWLREPRSGMAAIAAGSALVIVLGAWIAATNYSVIGMPRTYTTLTAPAPSSGGARLRLVVRPEISVGQLNALLRSVDAQLVAGPSPSGVYTLAVPSATEQALAEALARLRADPSVQFAEPVTPMGSTD